MELHFVMILNEEKESVPKVTKIVLKYTMYFYGNLGLVINFRVLKIFPCQSNFKLNMLLRNGGIDLFLNTWETEAGGYL